MSASIDQTAQHLSRLVDRLRSLPQSRLSRSAESLAGQSLADAGYDLSCWCVVAEAGLTSRDGPPVPHRSLPRLADLAAGDQLQVVGADLLSALAAAPDDEVWLGDQRVSSEQVLAELAERLVALRAVA